MTLEEFDKLQVGDWVCTPPYPAVGIVVRKLPTFINIEWSDLQTGTLSRGTWQMERLRKMARPDLQDGKLDAHIDYA